MKRLAWIVAIATTLGLSLAGCSEESGGGSSTEGDVGDNGSTDEGGAGDTGQDTATDSTGDDGAGGEGSDADSSEEDGSAIDVIDTEDDGQADTIAHDTEDGDTTDVDPPDTDMDGADDTGAPDAGDAGSDGTGADVNPEDVDEEDGGSEEPGTGFASAELNLRIIGPKPYDVGQSLGTIVPITGILFGHADTMVWEHLETGASGEIAVKPFWQSQEGVQLEQGDNPVKVTATNTLTGEIATDVITITYNPAFIWDSIPWVTPEVVFTGMSTNLVIRASMGLISNFNANTVEVWLTDAEGNPTTKVGGMKDDGNTGANCDEVDGDGVFSTCATINPPSAGLVRYRVRADVSNVFNEYEAWSPVFYVEAVNKVTMEECTSTTGTLQAAKAEYLTLRETMSEAEAQTTVIAMLLEDEGVAEAGPATDGYGIWVAFEGGLLGALNLNPEGIRGAGGPSSGAGLETSDYAAPAPIIDINSKRAVVLAPYMASFGDLDEAASIKDALIDVGCPAFDVSYKTDAAADIYSFRHLNEAGVVAITSHGDALFKDLTEERRAAFDWEDIPSQEVIWTGEAVDCGKLLQNLPTGCSPGGSVCSGGAGECVLGKSNACVDYKHADLRRGRMILSDTTYGILPEFVSFHSQRRQLPRSVAYLGSCRSMYNGGFAGALFANGARSVAGYTDFTTSQFASTRGASFFESMVLGGMNTGEALDLQDAIEDPDHPGTYFRLFGAPNLSLSNANIVNASFESGDDTGWESSGDGRVISALGCTLPVDGKFMGLVSTGLGFTQTTGELKQKFCIDAAKTTMSFYWKYHSEEFLEWCGSSFQDAFRATLKGGAGQLTLVDVAVDDLCPAQECGGCGGQYVGLVPSCVSFDQGGVYNTSWQKTEKGIALLAGAGAVTLSFFTTDQGDSIYDTVILIDKVEFK